VNAERKIATHLVLFVDKPDLHLCFRIAQALGDDIRAASVRVERGLRDVRAAPANDAGRVLGMEGKVPHLSARKAGYQEGVRTRRRGCGNQASEIEEGGRSGRVRRGSTVACVLAPCSGSHLALRYAETRWPCPISITKKRYSRGGTVLFSEAVSQLARLLSLKMLTVEVVDVLNT
jgi:hypothetical protein